MDRLAGATTRLRSMLPTDGGSWLTATDYHEKGRFAEDFHFSERETSDLYNVLRAELRHDYTLFQSETNHE